MFEVGYEGSYKEKIRHVLGFFRSFSWEETDVEKKDNIRATGARKKEKRERTENRGWRKKYGVGIQRIVMGQIINFENSCSKIWEREIEYDYIWNPIAWVGGLVHVVNLIDI